MATVGVLGSGTWGIALARLLALSEHKVIVWSAISEEVDELSSTRKHRNLPNMWIPNSILFTKDIEIACRGQDVILFAVPSVYVRSTARLAKSYIDSEQLVVDVAKGIEPHTLMTMSEVIHSEIPQASVVALSGPTHAEEVSRDMPTTIVAACDDFEKAERVQNIFSNSIMRVYTNIDVKGIELCGALKNIIALASGIANGMGFGDNAQAALITRGLSEISRLGVKMGCLNETFSGLAGMGDLIVTSMSSHSRNNKCGYLIGQGYSIDDAVKQVGMVVEGINAIPAAIELSEKYEVDIPIIRAVDGIINHGANLHDTAKSLMERAGISELPKSVLDLCYESAVMKNTSMSLRGDQSMKRVITYGTFDLLHYGHINLLRRAKALGDYLIVAISTDEFNWNEKSKKCYFSYEQRKALVESIRYVDLVIPEENWSQKRTDMHEYHIDTFVMGDDWKGKFDFLKEEGVDVVYLTRTPEISSTKMKKDLYDANSVEGDSKTKHDDIDTDPDNT